MLSDHGLDFYSTQNELKTWAWSPVLTHISNYYVTEERRSFQLGQREKVLPLIDLRKSDQLQFFHVCCIWFKLFAQGSYMQPNIMCVCVCVREWQSTLIVRMSPLTLWLLPFSSSLSVTLSLPSLFLWLPLALCTGCAVLFFITLSLASFDLQKLKPIVKEEMRRRGIIRLSYSSFARCTEFRLIEQKGWADERGWWKPPFCSRDVCLS